MGEQDTAGTHIVKGANPCRVGPFLCLHNSLIGGWGTRGEWTRPRALVTQKGESRSAVAHPPAPRAPQRS